MKKEYDSRAENSEEEQTYNNLESIQGFMKKSDQNLNDSEIEKSIEGDEDQYRSEPEPEIQIKTQPKKKKQVEEIYDYNEYEDDDDYEDEDFDEDDSDNESFKNLTKKKRGRENKKRNKKKKTKKNDINNYLDMEASSDDSEESDDEGAELTKEQQKRLMAEQVERQDKIFAPKKKRLHDILPENEEELIKRYEDLDDSYENDYEQGDFVGQQGRQPGIEDPKLWLVKCRLGKERECVNNIYHKFFALNSSENKIKILSALCFDSLKGYIYIEAFKEANVREAIQGISALKETSIKIVPLTEMTTVFNYDKIQKIELKPRQWVRMKSGIYEGDLAQVILVEDPINKIYVKIIPRLSENNDKKKKNDYIRPKQKLFNPCYFEQNEIKSITHPILRETVFVYNKMNFHDGFLIKSVRIKSLLTDNIVPNIEELKIFDYNKYKQGEETGSIDMSSLLNTIQDKNEFTKKKIYNKGDKIKIIKGGLINITGKVISQSNGVVNLITDLEGINDILELPENYLMKWFLPGDLVRVTNGINFGKYGKIVKIEDDTAIIYSDSTDTEFKVSCHDIIHSSQNMIESEFNDYYQLGDLVKINSNNTICYILDVQKHMLKVLDTRGEIKNINTRDVMKMTQSKPNGIDCKKNPITKNDTVKIVNGEYKAKKGVVMSIFKNFVFLHNVDFFSTNGIFVVKTDNVEIMGSELLVDNELNSYGLKVNFRKPPENLRKLVGKSVQILRGNWKGHIGILRNVNEKLASVELSAKNKIINIDPSNIEDVNPDANTNSQRFESIIGTPKSGYESRTPAYYPQSPSYNSISSPRWHPNATPNYYNYNSPNPNKDLFNSPGSNYK